ncbi:capsule biosynthesis protein [Falsiroseomonas sp. HW251]|uniref:capsule biosynthesis protein n=1 Tax=Falsiroseomonas sp. HW251 TaxID=3390998 RepID=UPI003D31F626
MKLSPPTRVSEPLVAAGLTPTAEPRRAIRRPPRRRLGVWQWFLLLVVLPTVALAGYFVFVAADVYESEARFLVRNRSSSAAGGGSTGSGDASAGGRMAALSALTAARPGQDEARAIMSYLDSPAALIALRREVDYVSLWRAPEADFLARLWWEQPPLEWMLWYFRRRVAVEQDADTGVLKLRVQAFQAADARLLAQQVLRISEALVNTLNDRLTADALRVAQEDVDKSEQRMVNAREAMIAFREREQAFDPQATAGAQVGTISSLQAALAQARTDFAERRAFMRPDNPQLQALQNRISALQAQINAERERSTRGDERLTQQVAAYERLDLERQLAERQLASATATLETARTDALRQTVFIARISEPHMPETATYPKATFNTFTVFLSLSVLFGIGWLLVVSAREHAA